ncbi:MAG: biotin/lipoyl-binding protein, partial [Anaerolineae bacterium]|nr:biotin/lipoyl-binding protein [Anaerolineae bacterium]
MITPFLLLLSVVWFTACTVQDTDETVADAPIMTDEAFAVVAEGMVIPNDESHLMLLVSGKVEAIYVDEGEWVQQGDVLIQLSGKEPVDAEIKSLEYQLLLAEQALDDLQSQADLEREQYSLKVIEAQTAYNAAEAAYDAYDFDRFEDDLENIEEEIIDARLDVEDAQDELADYLDLDDDNLTRKRYQQALDDAEEKLNELKREKSGLVNEHERVLLTRDAALAELHLVQKEAEKRQDGPDTDQLAAVKAQIESLQSSIDAANYQLDQLTLTAPFSGQVLEINASVDEAVAAGQIVIILADTNTWHIETNDLNELEIVQI